MGGFTWILVFCFLSVASCIVHNDTALNGDVLKQMGHIYNNPLLRLLGSAFDDIEQSLKEKIKTRGIQMLEGDYSANATFMEHVCQLMKCGRWSDWSSCRQGPYEFSMRLRSRQCGADTDLCTYPAQDKRNETQSEVCSWRDEGKNCPPDYDIVNGQYCFTYVSDGIEQQDAADVCARDGGHLVHVDSLKKSNALHKYLRKQGESTSQSIWLNGRRPTRYGPWAYTYGDRSPAWTNWSSGEPSNGSSEKCQVEESDPRKMFDRECSNNYHYVCEIV